MKIAPYIASLPLLAGCQEYNVQGNAPDFGAPNPADLENPAQEDRIVQVTTPVVDILWVVDNSSSMGPYQTALAENFPMFMDFFLNSGLDYHIGVVATEMQRPQQFNGKLREASTGERYITVDTLDPMEVFREMAEVGEIVGSVERGRDATYTALEILKEDYNAGFLRDDQGGSVHTIIISDEPDYSNAQVISKSEFVEYLNGLRPEDELVTFNSIVLPSTGGDYIDVTNGVGGILHSIADDGWVDVLEQLGMQAAGLKREYFLSQLPVVDTIEVRVQDPAGNTIVFEEAEYVYSSARNSITFNTFIPEPLSQVFIDYTVLSAIVETE